MKVLVLGGTYFVGRVFVQVAAKQEDLSLTLLNRGRYSMGKAEIREIRCDRHDRPAMEQALSGTAWDAVVDFCAYEPGDLETVFQIPGFHASHYILMSSSSVCDVPASEAKTEQSPVIRTPDETRDGVYAYKKGVLEAELRSLCRKSDTTWTILRPAFIYGPYNYAERESWFIRMIAAGEKLPYPVGGGARFQFVYVADVARAILRCLEDPRAENEVFHLAGSEILDYPTFFSVLEACSDRPIQYVPVTEETIVQERIPMPFPIIRDDLCDGSRITEVLGFEYQSFTEGMRKTWKAWIPVFDPNV
ncbi:MAG: NAD-dependent epimerase/dehydratase family protein [Mogibacterium sp.]|nr:NAD-dependent epimerase/dehydratase family protein [Mogibacterium sp.]